jgi:hypothetical protein
MKTKTLTLLLFICALTMKAQTIEGTLSGGNSSDILNMMATFDTDPTNPIGTITIDGDIQIDQLTIIPKDVVLRFFNGAKLIVDKNVGNPSIKFENSIIDAEKFQIIEFLHFGSNYEDKISKVTGVIRNSYIYPEWFGGSSIEVNPNDYTFDDAFAIQLAINLTENEVKLSAGTYRIQHTLEKKRIDGEETAGVKLVGAGIGLTAILVMVHDINFIELRGTDGTEVHAGKRYNPLKNNVFKNFRLSGQLNANGDGALNGFYLYSTAYNSFENVEIHHFKESGILFDGNPDLNPDWTASLLTTIKFCHIRSNKNGIFNKINNGSPHLRLINSRIEQNFRVGVIWNSSYFHSQASSISFNGRSIQDDPLIDTTSDFPLGGFYNVDQKNYGDTQYHGPYLSKGIIIETTELDGNYPTAVTLKASRNAIIRSNSIQQTDQYLTNFKFSEKGLISVGGNLKYYQDNGETKKFRELASNTVIENNRISFYKTKGTTEIETDASIIRVGKWAMYTKIRNNCFLDNSATSVLGDSSGYKYIREFNRINNDGYGGFDVENSYIKLDDDECISKSKIDVANDLFLDKFNKPNQKDHAKLFYHGDELIIPVPSMKSENGIEVNGGSFVVSSNDPGAISGLYFYRAINFPQIRSAYSSTYMVTTTCNSSQAPQDTPNRFNICVMENGKIRFKSLYQNPIYVTISFIEKIGMYKE